MWIARQIIHSRRGGRRQDPNPETAHDDTSLRKSPPRVLRALLHTHYPTQRRPIRDTSTKNAFAKFQASIDKRFEKQLADFDEDEYRQLEYLKDLFAFLDEIAPDSDWDEDEVPVKKRGGNKRCARSCFQLTARSADHTHRRSVSVMSDSTTGSAASEAESNASRRPSGKSKAKCVAIASL